ncbi:uncharacterized protein LOC119462222 isoform X1 [Dermacentor silvarum]|uniref:uncharacterized protein LOC119462222 isoform X1 n=1 Tax=Dermacentor silvarum TaxID=543639 RepID=UPI0021017B8B|nr:uncharacterized protein LOC119462222 isoform X1 [Dermacentor silvarum]
MDWLNNIVKKRRYCELIFALALCHGIFLRLAMCDRGSAVFQDLLDMLNTTKKIYIYASTVRIDKDLGKENYTYYTKVYLNETDYDFKLFVPGFSRRNSRNGNNDAALGGVHPYDLHAKLRNCTQEAGLPGPCMNVPNWPERGNITKILWQYNPEGLCGIFFYFYQGHQICEIDIREDGLPGHTHDIFHVCQTMFSYICEHNSATPRIYRVG